MSHATTATKTTFLFLTTDQLDAGGYENWETETIYCLNKCGLHFYSPDGIGRIFTGDDYTIDEMIADQGERFIQVIEIK